MTESIRENVQRVQETIADACARVNRDPSEVTLVAVSKKKPVHDVLEALEAGLQHFGENRVEESQEKIPLVAQQLGTLPQPIWHMVGHVQSRKVKDVLSVFSVCHSIDSVKLARRIALVAEEMNFRPTVYIQVNTSGEPQKYGFEGHQWESQEAVFSSLMEDIQQILDLKSLSVRGLMTMAPYQAPEAEIRQVFASLAALKREIERRFAVTLPDLSMGMTDDYPIAIEEGATVIRVGRAIFGEREY